MIVTLMPRVPILTTDLHVLAMRALMGMDVLLAMVCVVE